MNNSTNDKILFMILNNEIKMMTSISADHWKWYQSLGGKPEEYDNIVRGFITDKHILFFKSNYKVDDEVLDKANTYGPLICHHLNKENLIIGCGLIQEADGTERPAKTLEKEEIEKYMALKQEQIKAANEKRQMEENMKKVEEMNKKEQLIEFKNNYNDEAFSKFAVKFTTLILIAAIISKVYLISSKKLLIDNRWNALLVFVQILSLIMAILFYKKKNAYAKHCSLLATITMYATFNLSEIIIGTFNFLFTVDQVYIMKLMEYAKKIKDKTKQNVEKQTKNK